MKEIEVLIPIVDLEPLISEEMRARWNKIYAGPMQPFPVNSTPIPYAPTCSQRDNLLSLHATLQDALTWLDEAPEFDDYRRKVIACLRSTEKVLGLAQSRPERKR